jgi:sigma-B regulation protein RsbU (phosphoserine phosphatase)
MPPVLFAVSPIGLPEAFAPVIYGRKGKLMLGRETEHITRRQRLRVLLIEHDDAFARTVGEILDQAREKIGSVVAVKSLRDATARLAEEEFGVILLEFFLPDGAGLANIEVLQAAAPHTPIVVVGAADDEAIALEAVHAGAQDYLVKAHLTPKWLLRSIRYTIERHESEIALIAQEEKYHAIFDHLVEGIFQTTPDGRYLLANMALARIYGYASPDELMQSVTDIGRRLYVAPGRREEFRRIMEEHDTLTNFESQIFRKDGSIIWISENCRAIRGPRNEVRYYEGTVEDITARRQAEEGVRESEALYHSLVETMPQNVFRKDLQGRFTFANQQYCQHYKATLEEILGKTDFDFFPVELATKYQKDDQEVMATGQTLELVEAHQPLGQPIGYVRVVKSPLRGPDGTVIGLQGIFWDITEQKLAEERVRQAQESLRESETLYHSLVDTMPQCIFRKDLEGRYTFANREFCRFVGHPPEEVIGKTIYDFLPRELAKLRQADDERVMQSRQPFTQIEASQFANKEVQYIQVLKIPILDIAGKVTGLQGMFWDITDIKLAEKRLSEARDELATSEEQLRARNQQMEEDLQMARDIQVAMLPQLYPVLPRGVDLEDSGFQFSHRYQPSGTVGGDFFSVSAISDLEVAVFVCDVAGHGVRSALITAMIRAIVEELRPIAAEPGEFMTDLNAKLHAILKPGGATLLTTAFYLVGNAATGQMRFANAGHPKPLLLRRAENLVEEIKSTTGTKSQPALGLFERFHYQTSEIKLAPRDLVLLHTDGLYEVSSPADELYTRAQLMETVQRHLARPAGELCDAVIQEIRRFAAAQEFEDDVCLVAMEFTPPAADKRR